MKSKFPFLKFLAVGYSVAFIALAPALMFVACTAPNPQYTPIPPGQPNTNTVPQYIPDPRINQYSNTVAAVAQGVAPVNPYAGITSWVLTAAFGIFGGISALVARSKSGALTGMAQAVVQAGAHAAVLDLAGNHPNFSAIASAINDQVPSTGSLTGTVPPATTKV